MSIKPRSGNGVCVSQERSCKRGTGSDGKEKQTQKYLLVGIKDKAGAERREAYLKLIRTRDVEGVQTICYQVKNEVKKVVPINGK